MNARLRILLVCAANCVVSVVSTCLYYHELRALAPYPYFATQLNAVLTLLSAGLILAALRLRSWCVGAGGKESVPLLAVLPERDRAHSGGMSCFCTCATVGVLASLQNVMEIASIDGMGDDNLPPILQQASVPLTFLLSVTVLRVKYRWTHVVGAVVVVAGVAATFAPLVDGGINVGWAMVFVASRVPQSLSAVVAERLLAGSEPGLEAPLMLSFVTQFAALPANAVFAFLMSLARGDDGGLSDDYSNGALCLFDSGSGIYANAPLDAPASTVIGRCDRALLAALVFAVPGGLYLVTEYQVVQEAGAAVYFLLGALQLPIQDTVLSMHAIMGDEASTFHPLYAVGISVVVVGLCVYGAYPVTGVDSPDAADAADSEGPDVVSGDVQRVQ
eukprot:TRINITY_DN9315_c0_g1_i1.p1 TRINITY_DN9315_c0_g1~~TRINITY_DN9315_c0_g1_i1.p1  ORF type:complete len:389 (+),score=113.31 TRINITY_DN9315_c0_g1_i1:65-1231(+)